MRADMILLVSHALHRRRDSREQKSWYIDWRLIFDTLSIRRPAPYVKIRRVRVNCIVQ